MQDTGKFMMILVLVPGSIVALILIFVTLDEWTQ